MSDIESMKVLDCVKDLIEDASSSPFFDAYFTVHYSKQFALLSELRDYEKMLSSDDDFIEMDNIRVAGKLHDFHLPSNASLILIIFNTSFIDDFDCHLFTCGDVNCLFHSSKCTLPQRLAQLVVTYPRGKPRLPFFFVVVAVIGRGMFLGEGLLGGCVTTGVRGSVVIDG